MDVSLLLAVPFLSAIFLALNMGGSGVAPAFSVGYGAEMIKKHWIPWLFGVFVWLGALLAGGEVVKTLSKEILPESYMNLTVTTIILVASAVSIYFANLLHVPQSTSQSTVLALTAIAVYFNVFKAEKLFFAIIPAWFILPVISFCALYVVGKYGFGLLKARFIQNMSPRCKSLFRWVVISTSCYVAFSIGSNNVANAVGPLSSLLVNQFHLTPGSAEYQLYVYFAIFLVAPCFGIGSGLFGFKVMRTIGKEIVEMNALEATLVSFVTGSLLLFASLSEGIPTSLVQLNVGAVLGLGIARSGVREVLQKFSVKKVIGVWLLAPVFAFFFALALIWLADEFHWL